ncbi:MAG: tRNA 2-thiouridine(34) synthase MnmA [Lentisphaerae bacterium]|nr:tRNA 2-thiouridine(34) synthase MnmA [Lentisphaerota bacterium]
MRSTEQGKIRVAVGMSGGVDSAMTAALLRKEGYSVIGLTMQTWDGTVAMKDEGRSGCFGPGEARDIEAARSQAERLGIPHHVIPLAETYKTEVLDYFRREYRSGRTPNPCARCNQRVKFGALPEKARELGLEFDYFATGHYARVCFDNARGRFLLLRGADLRKDQSYFLSQLTQDQLQESLFPLGRLAKQEVKLLAREWGWSALADKDESQDFIEGRSYTALFDAADDRPGPIRDLQGHVLGSHRGLIHYTVGQRKGLGLSGAGEPLYVLRLDACSNTLIVASRDYLFSDRLHAVAVNWIAVEQAPEDPLRVKVKIRQQHQEADAVLRSDAAIAPNAVQVVFDEPQMAVTPGQMAVFYRGDAVLGGGTIVTPP